MYETPLASQYPSSASTLAPVPPVPPMVVEEHPELQVKDSKPIILLDPLRVTYSFSLPMKNLKLMEIKDLHMLFIEEDPQVTHLSKVLNQSS